MKDEKLKLVLEIMALAVLVDQQTKYCVFCDYAGHVELLNVSIRENKKKYYNKIAESSTYRIFKDYNEKGDPNAFLKSRRDVLREILETHDIPYHEMTEHVEEIRNYKF